MMNGQNMTAQQVYATMCQALDERNWKYTRFEEDLVVSFGVNGDDLPMNFVLQVDEERQVIRLMSGLPFKMPEDKRVEGAIAAAVTASMGMDLDTVLDAAKDAYSMNKL